MQNSLQEAKSYSGYLEKKSPSLFGGWQKRFFKIIDGRVCTYSEKENDKDYKGLINLEEISNLKAVEKKK